MAPPRTTTPTTPDERGQSIEKELAESREEPKQTRRACARAQNVEEQRSKPAFMQRAPASVRARHC
jgi:hypothetical protein